LDASKAASFIVNIGSLWVAHIEDCCMDNSRTNERLVIREDYDYVTCSRYPIGAKKEWIEEMQKGPSCEYRNIEIDI
jgi:hypothetical protein